MHFPRLHRSVFLCVGAALGRAKHGARPSISASSTNERHFPRSKQRRRPLGAVLCNYTVGAHTPRKIYRQHRNFQLFSSWRSLRRRRFLFGSEWAQRLQVKTLGNPRGLGAFLKMRMHTGQALALAFLGFVCVAETQTLRPFHLHIGTDNMSFCILKLLKAFKIQWFNSVYLCLFNFFLLIIFKAACLSLGTYILYILDAAF
jgi:hypothetical protein